MLMSFFSSIITFEKFVCFLVEFLVHVLIMKLDNFIVNFFFLKIKQFSFWMGLSNKSNCIYVEKFD